MIKSASDSVKWSITFIVLTSILASVEAEVVFFASTLVGEEIYASAACFLIVRLLQTFIGLYAALFRSKSVVVIYWVVALMEITCIAISLAFVDFTRIFNNMFIDTDVPPKYDHHVSFLAQTYLIYSVIIKVILVLVGIYLSFDEDLVRIVDTNESEMVSLPQSPVTTPPPIAINIHEHREVKPATTRNQQQNYSDVTKRDTQPKSKTVKPNKSPATKYPRATHFLSKAQPATTDTIIPSVNSKAMQQDGSATKDSNAHSGPFGTSGTIKFG